MDRESTSNQGQNHLPVATRRRSQSTSGWISTQLHPILFWRTSGAAAAAAAAEAAPHAHSTSPLRHGSHEKGKRRTTRLYHLDRIENPRPWMVHPREILRRGYHKICGKGKLARNNFPGKTSVYLLRGRCRPTRATQTDRGYATRHRNQSEWGTRAAEESIAWLAIGRIHGRDGALTSATDQPERRWRRRRRSVSIPRRGGHRAHPSRLRGKDEGAEKVVRILPNNGVYLWVWIWRRRPLCLGLGRTVLDSSANPIFFYHSLFFNQERKKYSTPSVRLIVQLWETCRSNCVNFD
jgi:hypothetical protein